MKTRKTKLAVVLGCGPAGLFATHALIQRGWDVAVFSKKRRSEMFGAQYLHAPILGLTDGVGRTLSYELQGTIEGYAKKVYSGAVPPEATSAATLEGKHEVWDIRQSYHRAWDLYRDRIISENVTPSFVGRLLDDKRIRLVVSSIPAKALCYQAPHKFSSQYVWAVGDAPERGIFSPVEFRPKNPETVICNGDPGVGWYRLSNVFGYTSVEYPDGTKPPLQGLSHVEKPIATDCDCFVGKKFLRVGRYGTWTKGVLSHHAYEAAAERG